MFTNKKVLIVDDEEQSRLYLANILREIYPDLRILHAASPFEGVFLLGSECFDLLFLDVEMPGISGLEMLVQLGEKIVETPVIFVSAYKRAEFIQQALRLNAIDYIDKPVDPLELRTATNKAFSKPTVQPDKTAVFSHSLRQLSVNTAKGQMLFEPSEVLYFESAKRNSVIYFANNNKDVVARENLIGLIDFLPSDIFKRVSRKYIVNANYIKYISKCNQTITLVSQSKTVELRQISSSFFDIVK